MANLEVLEAMNKKRLKHWEVANALQINPCTLSRWLRTELDQEKKKKVLNAIKTIK